MKNTLQTISPENQNNKKISKNRKSQITNLTEYNRETGFDAYKSGGEENYKRN